MGKAKHPHDSKRPPPRAIRVALLADDIEGVLRALSVRQRRFAEEYVVDFNGAAAAVRAGYSHNHADRQAYLLVRHEGVRAYIDQLTRTKQAKIMSISPDYVISQVTEIIGKEGAKDGDRLRGLELLARHLGMFIDRTEITGKDGSAIEIEKREIKSEADQFTNLIMGLAERAVKDKK